MLCVPKNCRNWCEYRTIAHVTNWIEFLAGRMAYTHIVRVMPLIIWWWSNETIARTYPRIHCERTYYIIFLLLINEQIMEIIIIMNCRHKVVEMLGARSHSYSRARCTAPMFHSDIASHWTTANDKNQMVGTFNKLISRRMRKRIIWKQIPNTHTQSRTNMLMCWCWE